MNHRAIANHHFTCDSSSLKHQGFPHVNTTPLTMGSNGLSQGGRGPGADWGLISNLKLKQSAANPQHHRFPFRAKGMSIPAECPPPLSYSCIRRLLTTVLDNPQDFVSKLPLLTETQDETGFYCSSCKKKFASSSTFKAHIESKHKGAKQSPKSSPSKPTPKSQSPKSSPSIKSLAKVSTPPPPPPPPHT
jgi:hypothetical protein